MRYRRFEPLDRDLSLLVLGTAVYRAAPDDASLELLDAWLELGGTIIDTGREYGTSERIVGRWVQERGVREEVTVLTKGAHQDDTRKRVTPEDITADLNESLATLGVDAVDLYLLHRDDPSKPVGPILEALEQHRQARRIRAYGASNWSTQRLEEAGAYATEHGLAGFACASPGLSLAVPSEPPWLGCVSASDPASRAWYAQSGLPVFAWSSQAGGFFAGVESADVMRVYDHAANRARLKRARELASIRGCSANHIALAWVLQQPFLVFALIGPRTTDELRDSLVALDVQLTAEEHRWLEVGDAAE